MKISNIKFEKNEILEIIFSMLILSFIFSLEKFNINLTFFPYVTILVILSFFPRFLIQKYLAKRLGYYSKYRIYIPSLFISVLVSFLGVKLAAPGYTEVSPYKFSYWKHSRIKISNEEIGKLVLFSLSYNIILSLFGIFFGFQNLKVINAWIILSNLLPILPLDGTKVLRWDFGVWFFVFIFSIFLLII